MFPPAPVLDPVVKIVPPVPSPPAPLPAPPPPTPDPAGPAAAAVVVSSSSPHAHAPPSRTASATNPSAFVARISPTSCGRGRLFDDSTPGRERQARSRRDGFGLRH